MGTESSERGTSISTDFRQVGTGLTVYQDDEAVEGTAIWLDSPDAVLDFVDENDVEDFIVIARGGTTTFLTPALVAGVKGVVTLQGAPESHLGIVSREFGIPCLMSVAFTEGTRTSRGETVPPDGATVRIDISTTPKGTVLVAPDTDPGTSADGSGPTDEEIAQNAELQRLIENYRGEVPPNADGDEEMRSRQRTGVLELTDETLRRDLTDTEVNDLVDYYGWNLFDVLAKRVTEGESGLIPRQEYEVVSVYNQWVRHPEWHRRITEKVGVDGLADIGATARRELSTKINPLHVWACGTPVATGRGITIDLGLCRPEDRVADLAGAMQFTRRLYRGMWGDDGPMFTSARGYRAHDLDPSWLERFRDERTAITDPTQRTLFQKFNAGTGLQSFLLHFDSRCGVADSGPYSTSDGEWVLVRDQVLNEPAYPWSTHCADLPYSITLAIFLNDDPDMVKRVIDIGTLFTVPATYLRHVTGYAVYARDTQDSPMSALRLLADGEMAEILRRSDAANKALYPAIAAMSERDKVLAGVHVYNVDFIAPIARAAGMWDEMVASGFLELEPTIDDVYGEIVGNGRAGELLLKHWITGAGMQHVPE